MSRADVAGVIASDMYGGMKRNGNGNTTGSPQGADAHLRIADRARRRQRDQFRGRHVDHGRRGYAAERHLGAAGDEPATEDMNGLTAIRGSAAWLEIGCRKHRYEHAHSVIL